MRRREFITLLGGAAVAWPVAVRAQQSEQVRRIGMLVNGPETDAEVAARIAAFRKALQDFGWIPGTNLRVDIRFGVDNEELREKAKELVGLAPDVVWAIATPSVMALRRVTRTVPIVFVAVTDPVGLGIVQNLARPGGSATGFLSAEFGFGAKLLELLKEIAPGVRRVIILTDLDNPSAAPQFAAIQTVAPSIGVELKLLGTNDSGLIERGISDFARAGNAGVIALRVQEVITHRKLIIKLAAQHRLPAIYPLHIFAADGGLISYGPDVVDASRQAASYVDRILKGEKPADLPVQAPTKYELVVNLKTAKTLGLTIPPAVLARADSVIE
jgi:putative tryptophan/tyrosine transport system substrate-binding protein